MLARSLHRHAPPRPSWHDLFVAEAGYVTATLRRLGAREADVEDLAHEVFIAAFRRIDAYDPSRPLRPWLFGFALRIASRWSATAFNRRVLVGGTLDDRAIPGANEVMPDRGLAHALVRRALDRVPGPARDILVEHDVRERTMPEIAASLRIPVNTGYARLRRGRVALREALVQLGHDD